MRFPSLRSRAAFVSCAILLCSAAALHAQSALVDIRSLTPQEYRAEGFVLTAPQTLQVEAVAAEPRFDRGDWGRNAEKWFGPDDERDTWPAAAWITDARTHEVVWDVRTASTNRSRNGLRRFAGAVRLPAGTYIAHYGSYVATSVNINNGTGDLMQILRLRRNRSRVTYSGPYVDDGSYRELQLVIRGDGQHAGARELHDAEQAFEQTTAFSLHPDSASAVLRYGFQLDRPTDVELIGVGEMRHDGAFDYGWILNADTRRRVWTMAYDRSDDGGGAHKNRQVRQTVKLPAGRYVAYYVTDDSHGPDDWNAVPPFNPGTWGLTARIADADARAHVRPFTFVPVPDGQTIVSMIGIGDSEMRSEGFTLRRAMDVRIYAIGEGSNPDGEMDDYAWIVDTGSRHRVWTMTYENTEHAGGADKNRLFDGVVHLEPGSYMVYYTSDGSHSYDEWNAAPPAESRYWGVSVFPATGTLDRSAIAPYERTRGAAIAELVRARNDVHLRTSFRIDREQSVRVVAMGEADGGEMADYGWIEDANTGRRVWEMTERMTTHAGGARKNRLFDGTVRLPAGTYVLHYETDGSHAYGDWNDAPPDDPEGWGIVVLPARER